MNHCVYAVCLGDDQLQVSFLEGMLRTLRGPGQFYGDLYVVADAPAAIAVARAYDAEPVPVTSPDGTFDAYCRARIDADESFGLPLARYDTVTYCDLDVVWLRPFDGWAKEVWPDRPLCVRERHTLRNNRMAEFGWPQKWLELAEKMGTLSICTGLMAWPGRKTACTLKAWRDCYHSLEPSPGREQSAFNLLVMQGKVCPHFVDRGMVGNLSERHCWQPDTDTKERVARRMVAAHCSGFCGDKSAVVRIWDACMDLAMAGRPELVEALL